MATTHIDRTPTTHSPHTLHTHTHCSFLRCHPVWPAPVRLHAHCNLSINQALQIRLSKFNWLWFCKVRNTFLHVCAWECMYVCVCVCVYCLICSVLLLIEWQMFYAVPNWDVNDYESPRVYKRNCVCHALLFTLSPFPLCCWHLNFWLSILLQVYWSYLSLAYFDYQISSKHNFQYEFKVIFVCFLFNFFLFSLTFLYPVPACHMGGELFDEYHTRIVES